MSNPSNLPIGKLLKDQKVVIDSPNNEPISQLGQTSPPVTYNQQVSPNNSNFTSGNSPRPWKAFPFALERDGDNIKIHHGRLIYQTNSINFKEANGYDKFVDQTGLNKPIIEIPNQFKNAQFNQHRPVEIDWAGNVYLYWETDESGKVTKCEIKGPDEPPHVPLPLAEGESIGKFWVKIGSVDEDEINQDVGSDVFWNGSFIKIGNGSGSFSGSSSSSDSSSSISSDSSGGSSVSDGSSGSSGSSGSPGSASSAASGSSVSGSDKSTAIVPMPWHPKGYGALFTMESNEVLFDFVLRDIPILGRQTQVKIDPRFLYVCEQGSIAVTGAPCGPEPYPVGASVKGDTLTLSAYARKDRRPSKVTLKLTGVRRGFAGYDMPERSKAQFDANEKFLNSAYPAE